MYSRLPKTERRKFLIHSVRCINTTPAKSHPNRYWRRNQNTFLDLAEKADQNNAMLVIVNYRDEMDQFKVIRVYDFNNSVGIAKEKSEVMNRQEYDRWMSNVKKSYEII